MFVFALVDDDVCGERDGVHSNGHVERSFAGMEVACLSTFWCCLCLGCDDTK